MFVVLRVGHETDHAAETDHARDERYDLVPSVQLAERAEDVKGSRRTGWRRKTEGVSPPRSTEASLKTDRAQGEHGL